MWRGSIRRQRKRCCSRRISTIYSLSVKSCEGTVKACWIDTAILTTTCFQTVGFVGTAEPVDIPMVLAGVFMLHGL